MTDLEACYDRQLPNTCSIVQESVGTDRREIKLIIKTIRNFRHYLCTNFGISQNYYGGELDNLAGTGQGNTISGNHCRDVSCIIIREIEKQNLGMQVRNNYNRSKHLRTALAFVDDTDFYANGKECEDKLNKIINQYGIRHETIGGKIEIQKTSSFSWQWKLKTVKR